MSNLFNNLTIIRNFHIVISITIAIITISIVLITFIITTIRVIKFIIINVIKTFKITIFIIATITTMRIMVIIINLIITNVAIKRTYLFKKFILLILTNDFITFINYFNADYKNSIVTNIIHFIKT